MAPRKPATSASRSSGRIKQAAVAPVAGVEAPKKRGRPAKAADPVQNVPPKKRGRALKAAVEKAAQAAEPKARGRPKAAAASALEDAPTPSKRAGGRPRKQKTAAAAATEAAAAPKRRGRPPKSAADLERVAGPARVTKRSARPRTTTNAASPATTSQRIDPRIRAKLRTRAPPVEEAPVVEDVKPKRRMGRPPKKETAAAAASKKTTERKTKDARVKKTPTKPRKRRGYTTLEIPDKYVKQVQDFIHGLIDDDNAAAAAEAPVEKEQANEEQANEEQANEEQATEEQATEEQATEEQANEGVEGEEASGIAGADEQEVREEINAAGVNEDVFEMELGTTDQLVVEEFHNMDAAAEEPPAYLTSYESRVIVEDLGSGSVDGSDEDSVVQDMILAEVAEERHLEDTTEPNTPFSNFGGSMSQPLLTSTPHLPIAAIQPPSFD